MNKLKIEYVKLSEIKPYEKNAKLHPREQVEQIKESIKAFGNLDPIGVWNGQIVEGHGRYMAAEQLGLSEVPIIRLDSLTDEQRKAYGLIHNKLTMNSDFDLDLLSEELEGISEIDMSDFGFDLDLDEEEEEEDLRDPSCQHNVFENQERMQFPADNYYGIPVMEATQTVGDKFLRFMDYNLLEDHSQHIAHFYYDDYKFIEAWRDPNKYLDKLRKFKAVVSPDFSLYTDFPRALQILSCYRRQWCGAYWQSLGLDVIPDIAWGDEESFNYCFDGIPERSVVAVSSVGVKGNKEAEVLFKAGYDEMLNRLKPTKVLYYGDMIDGLDGDIIQIPSYYAEKREYLNKKRRTKKNGSGS